MFSSWNLETWPAYSYETDTFPFPAVIWPVAFSLPALSSFLSLSLPISFVQAWPMTCFSFDTRSKLFPHWLPSHFVPLTMMCSLCCNILDIFSSCLHTCTHVHKHLQHTVPATFPEKNLCPASFVSTQVLHNLEHFWGAQNPSLSLLRRWEVSSLMVHGEQGSHSGLFFTGLFSVPDRECCNLQFVVYFLKKIFHFNLFLLLGVHHSTLKIF